MSVVIIMCVLGCLVIRLLIGGWLLMNHLKIKKMLKEKIK